MTDERRKLIAGLVIGMVLIAATLYIFGGMWQ